MAKLEIDPFHWGKVILTYEIGPYTIAAYHPWTFDSRHFTVEPKVLNSEVIYYYGWVGMQDTNHSWESLDAAMAGVIAYRCEGPNHRADMYFMRMLQEVKE